MGQVNIHITPQHGCYRCGAQAGEYTVNDMGMAVCGNCGEPSVVTFQQALDTLNDLYLRHGKFTHAEDEEDHLVEDSTS